MQAWHDESDGTILGSLGYDKVLESPAVAYDELQAQLLAYAEEHAPDSEAQQVTCCTAGADPFIKKWQTAPSIVPNSISFVAFPLNVACAISFKSQSGLICRSNFLCPLSSSTSLSFEVGA